jgi:hypothetical protein
MRDRPSRRILALFLGVFLALGAGLSAIQAGEMGLQKAMASDAGASGQGGCDGCGGSDDSSNAISCSSALSCSSAAVLPVANNFAQPQPVDRPLPIAGFARGLSAPPDPYPPRAIHLI